MQHIEKSGVNGTILIVDDSEVNRVILKKYLKTTIQYWKRKTVCRH